MNSELITITNSFKRTVDQEIEKVLTEMPYFNRSMKNKLMDRLLETLRHYNNDLDIRKLEDFIDFDLFPLINQQTKKVLLGRIDDISSVAKSFVQENSVVENGDKEKEIMKQQIDSIMSRLYSSTEEISEQKISFENLFEELEELFSKSKFAAPDNQDQTKEVKRIFSRTKEETEDYYKEKLKELVNKTQQKSEEVYGVRTSQLNSNTLNKPTTEAPSINPFD